MAAMVRRWLPLLSAAAALLAFLVADNRVRSGVGDRLGFCPADVQWTLAARDLPRVRQALETTDAYTRVRDDWRPLDTLDLAVRKAVGIRPTPPRWTLWMGRSLVSAGGPVGTGGCVYPGLLIRALHGVNRLIDEPHGGVYRLGRYRYAWREGFLIFSTEGRYVSAALEADPFSLPADAAPDALYWHWRGAPEASFRFLAQDGLPLEGWVDLQVTERDQALDIPGGGDETRAPALMRIAATACADVETLWDLAMRPLAGLESAGIAPMPALRPFPYLDDPRLAGTDRCVLALHADPEAGRPDLRHLLRVRPGVANPMGNHPFAGLPDTQGGYFALGRSGPDWYVAESPDLGAETAAADPVAVDADAWIGIDWGPFGQSAEALAMHRAEAMDGDDDHRIEYLRRRVPAARGIARAGTCELQGHMRDGRLAVSGQLAAPGR